MNNSEKWNAYANGRLLERNRLTVEHHQGVVKAYIDFFQDVDSDKKVLDLACGGGFFLEVLRNLGFVHIQGIDLSEPFVLRACSKNLNVTLGSILEIAFQDEFDVITCMEIFEHLEQPLPIQKIARALKKNGILFVTVPVYNSFRHRLERLCSRITKLEQAKEHDPTHVKAYSKDLLCKEVMASGAFRLRFARHCYNPIPGLPLRSIWRLSERVFKSGMFLVAVFEKR